LDYSALAAAIASAIFWYRGSDVENLSPVLWVLPSIAISGVIILGLHGGWIAVLLGQAAMFVGVAVYRMVADKDTTNS
jgi:hypothetical protein